MTRVFTNEARTAARHRELKKLWWGAKKVPNFKSFGCPSVDVEVRRVWGDWETRETPYPVPYSETAPEKETRQQRDPNAVSPWGRDVVDRIREMDGFADTKASQLDDKNLAKLIWKHWQALSGTNKLVKVLGLIILEETE